MKSVFLKITFIVTLASFVLQAQVILIPQDSTISSEPETIPIQEETFTLTAEGNAVRDRLRRIEGRIPLPYNQTVHGFIDYFIYRKPSYTKTMLERKDMYFPLFESYMRKYGIPEEIKYLAVVESGLNPKAISRVKAMGMWQFMRVTGKEYNLKIDEYIDERMHVEKSTDAACRYLRNVYNVLGDWHLALASYNSGLGRVRRAIKKAGGVYDFWVVYPYLPRETRSYVPQFIALAYMMNYANEHGIFAEVVENEIESSSITVDSYLDLNVFSSLSGMDLEDIQKLNPHIVKTILPAYTRDFELRIPTKNYSDFIANRQMILDSASQMPGASSSVILANSNGPEKPLIIYIGENETYKETDENGDPMLVAPKDDPEELIKSKKARKKVYAVRKGETLYRIADKFDVEVYDLKKWNNLRSSSIRPGQKLAIYVDSVIESEKYAKSSKKKSNVESKGRPKYYVVQRGDTLWNISQRYDMPLDKLKRLNGLKGNAVKVGQKLKVG